MDDPLTPPVMPELDIKDLFDYKQAEIPIKQLRGLSESWRDEADSRREMRFYTVDVQSKRDSGALEPDEMYIPIRLANMNIMREQSKYIAYLSGPRAAILTCINNGVVSTQALEKDYTDKFCYQNWQFPLYRTIDGFQCHGRSAVEVMFDQTKPGNFKVEDIPFEDLMIPTDAKDIQVCELIGRIHRVTKAQLEFYVLAKGWNADQVGKVIDVASGAGNADVTLYSVEKLYFKKNGTVYVGWACSTKCNDWLRAPIPLFLGRKDKQEQSAQLPPQVAGLLGQPQQPEPLWVETVEKDYPIVLFPYTINEDATISECKGRLFFDEYSQEAASSLMSNMCTGQRRAAGMYWSRGSDAPATNNAEEIKIAPNVILPSYLTATQLKAPDATLLQTIQALITENSQEVGQVNYAANNRKDSRKTATEIQSAQNDNAMLSTTQVSLFSASMQQVHELCWRIYSNRVVQGLIQPTVDMVYFSFKYIIKPAGEVDVIEREKKLQRMMQTWPIVAQTGAAGDFLKRFLALSFPEDAALYNSKIDSMDQATKLLSALFEIAKSLVFTPTGDIEPHVQPHIKELAPIFDQISQVTGIENPLKPEHGDTKNAPNPQPAQSQSVL